MRTCGRCGIADEAVLDLDTGGAFHPELQHCISRLRAEVEDVRRVEAWVKAKGNRTVEFDLYGTWQWTASTDEQMTQHAWGDTIADLGRALTQKGPGAR